MTLAKNKIWKILLLVILFTTTNLLGETPIREGEVRHPRPIRRIIDAVQTDGTEVKIFKTIHSNGYTHYTVAITQYTVIYDESKGDWCYARLDHDGFLESTGYPIHLHTGEDLGLRMGIRPRNDIMEGQRQKQRSDGTQTRSYNAPFRKMPSTAPEGDPIESIVIYVLLSDIALTDTVFIGNSHFNGDAPALSAQRYFKEMSNDLLDNQKQIYHHIYQLLTEMSKNHV